VNPLKSEPVPVTVTILDKEYRVACPPSERDALKASAELLDLRMREIRDAGKVIGGDRIAVMAALNIAHELLLQQESGGRIARTIGTRLQALQERVDIALAQTRQMDL
jgi:cell division protein ZapA